MKPIEVQAAMAEAVGEVLETMCFTAVLSSSDAAIPMTPECKCLIAALRFEGGCEGEFRVCIPMALARQIGMLSYKSPQLFDERFGRNPNRNGEEPWSLDDDGGGLIGGRFDVAGFLDYQGDRFLERFDANAYLAILRTMDLWDPVRGYARSEDAYTRIQAELIFIGISSDWLFPPQAVRLLAEQIGRCGVRAEYREMQTDHGHDAFLAEQQELVRLLQLRT